MSPRGALTTIYNFCTQAACPDGAQPGLDLVQAANGSLFGSTSVSGPNLTGFGTIYKVTLGGTLTTLYTFCRQSGCPDGTSAGQLLQAANGNLYGTAAGGTGCPVVGCGTIFKITPSGTFTTLYTFCLQGGCLDGGGPTVAFQAANGYLYGTTFQFGPNSSTCNSPAGGPCGTMFKMTPTGTLTTVYSFCNKSGCTDGAGPDRLIQGTDGNFYGTTYGGGIDCARNPNVGCGTVFKITPTGALTTLYSFCAQTGCPDGFGPFGLIQAASGDLYGLTSGDGGTCTNTAPVGCGTIFKISPNGTFTTLYTFCQQAACADGRLPEGLVQGTNGVFYGTTISGGAPSSDGTVFALSTGESAFVETNPTIGKVGEAVTILGYQLTGATSVTFNGVPSTFTVVKGTEITTTVPAGATTGNVQVITPSNTLSSNKAFEVAP